MDDALTRRDVLKAAAAGAAAAALAGPAPAAQGPGPVDGLMTGAKALVRALLAEGTDVVFGIPGAQDNELWDAMKTLCLPYLLVTHEFSASIMADGYARATGKPGVICLVPGPGITNAMTGIGEALLDSVPMVCIVCDVARGDKYHAFQVHELANEAILQTVTKKVFAVKDESEIAWAVRQAFACACAGEPGPVAVLVPYPLLIQAAKIYAAPICPPSLPWDEAAFQAALGCLADPKKCVGIYAGFGCMDHAAELVQVAEMLQAPVATSVSGKGVISECHPLSVGWGYGPQGTRTAEKIFKSVDLVLAVGVRFSEVSTGFYCLPEKPMIQVDSNPHNIGRNYKACVGVHADSGVFLHKLLEYADMLRRPPNGHLVGRIGELKKEDFQRHHHQYPVCGVDPMTLLLTLRRCSSPDALVYTDVSQFEHWAAEAFQVVQPRTYFNPTDNQAMGWSVPAALGGQRAFPHRQVIAVTGDGCFLMSAMELSTAARACLPVKCFVLEDHAYHYMQTLQRAAYLRTTATKLACIDYAALAKALGIAYAEIPCNADLDAGVHAALAHPEPILVRVITDYGKRPVRWIDAVRRRYMEELTPQQQVRFAARLGIRAAKGTSRDPKQND